MKKQKPISPYERQRLALTAEYTELSQRLAQCRINFDLVTEQEAIDALIFEENAILAKMAAVTREAKERGFYAEIHEQQSKNKLRT